MTISEAAKRAAKNIFKVLVPDIFYHQKQFVHIMDSFNPDLHCFDWLDGLIQQAIDEATTEKDAEIARLKDEYEKSADIFVKRGYELSEANSRLNAEIEALLLQRCADHGSMMTCQKVACLKTDLDMADSCLDMIREAIEQLGESCKNTPPMMYPEAIANLCAKRNREILRLKELVKAAFYEGRGSIMQKTHGAEPRNIDWDSSYAKQSLARGKK